MKRKGKKRERKEKMSTEKEAKLKALLNFYMTS
jgi:hypothetical protein